MKARKDVPDLRSLRPQIGATFLDTQKTADAYEMQMFNPFQVFFGPAQDVPKYLKKKPCL